MAGRRLSYHALTGGFGLAGGGGGASGGGKGHKGGSAKPHVAVLNGTSVPNLASRVDHDVIKAATNLQSHSTSNVSNVAQAAALAAVSGDLEAAATMRAAFDRRRLKIHELLNDVPGVTCIEPEGAFYAFPSFKGALDREIRGRRPTSSVELAETSVELATAALRKTETLPVKSPGTILERSTGD